MEKQNSTFDEIDDLIVRFFNGEITEDENDLLIHWLNISEDNKKKFHEMKITWNATAQFQDEDQELIQRSLNMLNAKIEKPTYEIQPRKKYSLSRFIRVAAVFLLAVSIGSLTTYFVLSNRTKSSDSLIYIYAPIGSRAMTLLPDGSKVWLNAGSKLTYQLSYNGKDRIVNLEGEGYFDVKTNPRKPFIVKARGLDIKAYGTAFNVKAYRDEKEVVTTLVHGKVFIEGKDKDNKEFVIRMKPKQSITYIMDTPKSETKQTEEAISDAAPVSKNNTEVGDEMQIPVISSDAVQTEIYTSWKDENWVIVGEELGKLASSLERKYNIKIVFQSEELKGYRFTGTFKNETVEQVFEVLKLTAPLKYEISPGVVTVTMNESMKAKFKKYFHSKK